MVPTKKKGEHRAIDSKDRARCACAIDCRIPKQAAEAPCDAGGKVDQCEVPTSKEPFRKASTDVQGPHVQREVKKPEVQEHRRNEAPPLTVRGERAEVSSPGL